MPNTVKLKNYSNHIEEGLAAAAITPGMLCELSSTANTYQKHSSAGENAARIFALEDELQGKGIDDDYSAADRVQLWYPAPGDMVYAILEDGENVSRGDLLESAGTGNLRKHSASSAGVVEYPEAVVAQAAEDLNLSASSGAESSGLQGNQRIKVIIV